MFRSLYDGEKISQIIVTDKIQEKYLKNILSEKRKSVLRDIKEKYNNAEMSGT